MICALTVTSSAEVGSSATSTEGPRISAAGDGHALALAAGQFVRVAAGRNCAVEADRLEPVERLLGLLARRAETVDVERLGDDLAQRHHRIERRIAVLEHDLHARGGKA